MKKCPYCAEEIKDKAIKCRWCGELMPEAPPALKEVSQAPRDAPTQPAAEPPPAQPSASPPDAPAPVARPGSTPPIEEVAGYQERPAPKRLPPRNEPAPYAHPASARNPASGYTPAPASRPTFRPAFTHCPSCRRDAYLFCENCGRADAFVLSPDAIRCDCGNAFSLTDCVHCQTRLNPTFVTSSTHELALYQAAQAHHPAHALAGNRSGSAGGLKAVVGVVIAIGLAIFFFNKLDCSSCGSSEDKKSMSQRAVEMCHQEVSKKLKDPSSAWFDAEPKIEDKGDNEFVITGTMRAKNSFGAYVPGSYACKLKHKEGKTWMVSYAFPL